ncbi:hypothetical protein B0H66DRAFT_81191 [Apodospora peruviana]|uniref:Zn(2)-C6 fungal-type domain-containing protein n=1 Tax=Apodospora peruviana TaxID=516989 RepID=A0AAE0ITE0_9PEZI|nr:hypothetical protein B0H66DRAFT_81191 [Apodospora peruviana]
MEGLPTPPNEDHLKSQASKKQHSHSKPVKAVHRGSKRASTHVHPPSPAQEIHAHSVADGRHKRVWKACERCRMKKTKCDGEFPCKRCKDDGLVCTAGTRKKTEYKQLPRGYAEVLENTQFALIATVHKLYAMVRSQQPWDLGEPELNDRGQPVIHNIASKLGCIRPNSDMDLPVHSIFPEDEAGLAELARQLDEQQKETGISSNNIKVETESICCGRTERASSSDLDHSDFEHDYRRVAFGGGARGGSGSVLTMSPASLTYGDFEINTGAATTPSDGFPTSQSTAASIPTPVLATSFGSPWMTTRRPAYHASQQSFMSAGGQPPFLDMDMLNQGLLESSFGTIKPHVLNCANPEVMMGLGDPMMYSPYDAEPLRL